MTNTVNPILLGLPSDSFEKNQLDINVFRFNLRSSRFKKGLIKEKIPKNLLETVKKYLKDNHQDMIKEAFGDLEIKQELSNIISHYISSNKITEQYKDSLGEITHSELVQTIVDEISGFGPLEYLFNIPSLTDIHLNGPNNIWIDDYRYGPRKVDTKFESKESYNALLSKLMNESNTFINYQNPQTKGALPRLRFDIIGQDLSKNVSCSIRVLSKELRINENTIFETNQASAEMLQFLQEIMKTRMRIIVSGETGAGKTEWMRFIAGYIPLGKKIITIEDVEELHLDHIYEGNISAWTTRNNVNADKALIWDLGHLVKVALRHNPKWLILGETRGAEIYHMMEAAQTGHGILTGVHSESAEGQIDRIITLLHEYKNGDDNVYGKTLTQYLDIGIHLERVGERQLRTVTKIVEFHDYYNNQLDYTTLFEYDHKTKKHVKKGQLSNELALRLSKDPMVNLSAIDFMISNENQEVLV